MSRSASAVDLLAATDPVAAFEEACDLGRAIALRTSGSSSRARMVLRSTASWIDSFDAVSSLAGTDGSSRIWIPGPLLSTMNLFAAVHARHAGAVIVDDSKACTHAYLTPVALETCLDAKLLADGVTIIVAGDSLRPALRERAQAYGLVVHHYYGASELSFVAWGSANDDLRAFPGVEVDMRDREIWVRSPYLSFGYAPGLTGGTFAEDAFGWATVGDRGILDDGILRVEGRGELAVTTAGATVLVADVEAALAPHARGTFIVTGLPHERLGAVLVAVVTDAPDAARLASLARQALPPAQRPRRWFHLSEVPTTPAGKVDRAVLPGLLATVSPLPMAR